MARVEELVRSAKSQGAQLTVLPENFAFFGTDEARCAIAEPASGEGPILSQLASLARELGVAIVGGGMPIVSADALRPYNASVCLDGTGAVVGVYRKIHLFDVDLPGDRYDESTATSAGEEPLVLSVAGLRVGLSVCYDLRFPVLYRKLVDLGANVLVVSAAFTEQTGKAHWDVLVRARAIESQCWVIAAAQWGQHPRGRRTFGHSMIVDPWGRVVSERAEGIGAITADVDLGLLSDCRERLPSLRHRRL